MGHFWIKFFLGNSQIQLRLETKVYKLSTNGLYFRGLPGDALQPTKRIRVITLTVSFVETHKDMLVTFVKFFIYKSFTERFTKRCFHLQNKIYRDLQNFFHLHCWKSHLQNNHLLGVQDSLAITVAITFTSVTKQVVQLLVEHILVNYNSWEIFLTRKGTKGLYI